LNLPIKITTLPVGSTCTIVYLKFKQYNLTIPEPLAKLMLGGILTDTVGLKSGTTTDKDRQAVNDLKTVSQINDIDAYTLEIFKAKSNISSLSPEQIVKNDYKIFDFAKKIFIGQLETVEQDDVIKNRKSELLAAMQQVKQSEGVELLFLVITRYFKVNSKIILLSEAEQSTATKAFGGAPSENILDIGPKLSRKKDIAPPIEKALNG
jgi:manganese-dependent inorganic pyrophosphatase